MVVNSVSTLHFITCWHGIKTKGKKIYIHPILSPPICLNVIKRLSLFLMLLLFYQWQMSAAASRVTYFIKKPRI